MVCFHNSLTFAFSEIIGRSYGGGVLCLEPNESEELLIPYFNVGEKIDISEIDRLIREDKIEEVLQITDKIILQDHLGLTKKQVDILRNIWEKLSNRRINRN